MQLWKSWWLSWSALLRNFVRASALFMISVYRTTLSAWVGGVCRFEPSCSCYAETAFKIHSPVMAFKLTLIRLLKCHPLGPFGYDPVPEQLRKSP
jgi:putative membrane protein insertion efficiency factor